MKATGPGPLRLLIGSFLALILSGTLLLKLPAATPAEQPINWTDALFTATSATCITGLAVRDTGSGFTLFGQLVILGLIQAGGLGVMTFSLFIMALVPRPGDVRAAFAVRAGLLAGRRRRPPLARPAPGLPLHLRDRRRRGRPALRPLAAGDGRRPGRLRGGLPRRLGVLQRRLRPAAATASGLAGRRLGGAHRLAADHRSAGSASSPVYELVQVAPAAGCALSVHSKLVLAVTAALILLRHRHDLALEAYRAFDDMAAGREGAGRLVPERDRRAPPASTRWISGRCSRPAAVRDDPADVRRRLAGLRAGGVKTTTVGSARRRGPGAPARPRPRQRLPPHARAAHGPQHPHASPSAGALGVVPALFALLVLQAPGGPSRTSARCSSTTSSKRSRRWRRSACRPASPPPSSRPPGCWSRSDVLRPARAADARQRGCLQPLRPRRLAAPRGRGHGRVTAWHRSR